MYIGGCALVTAADAGADITAVDRLGFNLLDYALEGVDSSWVSWVQSRGCKLPSGYDLRLLQQFKVSWHSVGMVVRLLWCFG
jgi:hypothetical protein